MTDRYIESYEEQMTHVCSICEGDYSGYGHSARPINDGRCCDVCNDTVVIPTRINFLTRHMLRCYHG